MVRLCVNIFMGNIDYVRVCKRCGRNFRLNPDGTYVTKEECIYHWGKAFHSRGRWSYTDSSFLFTDTHHLYWDGWCIISVLFVWVNEKFAYNVCYCHSKIQSGGLYQMICPVANVMSLVVLQETNPNPLNIAVPVWTLVHCHHLSYNPESNL